MDNTEFVICFVPLKGISKIDSWTVSKRQNSKRLNIKIIQVYASTTDSDEEIETFYEYIDQSISDQ